MTQRDSKTTHDEHGHNYVQHERRRWKRREGERGREREREREIERERETTNELIGGHPSDRP